jgi:trans-aconitate 2-methyltransferase
MTSAQYQFGDQDLAARRLEVVARVFELTTRDLFQWAAPPSGRVALDLGCGPGFTTRLLAEVSNCEVVAGLDTSDRFLARAQPAGSARIRFHAHDVLSTPLPGSPADLLFCRFLLSHLPAPRACLETWSTQLRSGGLLLIEEVEAIETVQPIFARYLGIVESLLRNHGTELYVGRVLGSLEAPPLLRKRLSRVRRFPVSDRDAATMFSMNVPNWKDTPFIRENFGGDSIESLEAQLSSLAGAAGGESSITWSLRQIVFERIPGTEAG